MADYRTEKRLPIALVSATEVAFLSLRHHHAIISTRTIAQDEQDIGPRWSGGAGFRRDESYEQQRHDARDNGL